MRKIVLMMLCIAVLGSTAFAKDIVIGGGGLFGLTFEEYHYPQTSTEYFATTHEVKETAYGGYVFFGLTRFMEASIAVFVNNNAVVWKWFDYNVNKPMEQPKKDYLGQQVGVSLYGKYPFVLSKIVLFPTVGLDLEGTNGSLDLFGGVGGGLDYFFPQFNQRLFIRVQAIYRAGFLYIYKYKDIKESFTTDKLAHGPLFKLGLGWVY